MKTKLTIFEDLRVVERDHLADRDGGYNLADSILSYYTQSSTDEKRILIDVLLELVANKDHSLWGVILEVLSRIDNPVIGANLLNLITDWQELNEWYDLILQTLTRLRYYPAAQQCEKYVEKGLWMKRYCVLTILAGLCHIDRDGFLRISVSFFETGVYECPNIVESYTPAFLHSITEHDEKLLCHLFQRIREKNPESATILRDYFWDYLDKPWVMKRFGIEKCEELKSYLEQ